MTKLVARTEISSGSLGSLLNKPPDYFGCSQGRLKL